MIQRFALAARQEWQRFPHRRLLIAAVLSLLAFLLLLPPVAAQLDRAQNVVARSRTRPSAIDS